MAACLISAIFWLGTVPAAGQETFLGRSTDQWSAALTSDKAQQRVHAAWAISQLAGRSAREPSGQESFAELVKLVNDGDASVRYWGVMGLADYAQPTGGQSGSRTAPTNTLHPLLADQSPAPRIAAAQVLGLLNQADKALPVLVAAMSDPQEAVRIQAVAALERLGPAARPAVETLRAATGDSSEYVKRISARALARLEAEKK